MQIGSIRFDRMELAGSLGDLGTLLPLAIGMIVVNGLDPVGLFASVGLFYIIAGTYYRVPISVQPMKTIGGYAVATGISGTALAASGLWMGSILLLLAKFDWLDRVRRWVPVPVIRGVQASTGLLLAMQGLKLLLGRSLMQSELSEPALGLGTLLGAPWSLILGIITVGTLLALIDNKRFPAALVVVCAGLGLGMLCAETLPSLEWGGVSLFPLGFPAWVDFATALPLLVLPQLPMTLGNAVFANADLSAQYFPQATDRVTPRALCVSMGLACIGSAFVGGMPMCHGAGGLAAHYRFGARTCGSNYLIGGLFVLISVAFGPDLVAAVQLLPFAVLGGLLFLAGMELCLAVRDQSERSGLFVIFVMVAVSLVSNLAIAFVVGALLAWWLTARQVRV